jgi:hypothetical protein
MTDHDRDDSRRNYVDGRRLVPSDLESEQSYRAPRRFLVATGGMIVAVAAILGARAWPKKWTGPELNADGTDVPIDTLELTSEGVQQRGDDDED